LHIKRPIGKELLNDGSAIVKREVLRFTKSGKT